MSTLKLQHCFFVFGSWIIGRHLVVITPCPHFEHGVWKFTLVFIDSSGSFPNETLDKQKELTCMLVDFLNFLFTSHIITSLCICHTPQVSAAIVFGCCELFWLKVMLEGEVGRGGLYLPTQPLGERLSLISREIGRRKQMPPGQKYCGINWISHPLYSCFLSFLSLIRETHTHTGSMSATWLATVELRLAGRWSVGQRRRQGERERRRPDRGREREKTLIWWHLGIRI